MTRDLNPYDELPKIRSEIEDHYGLMLDETWWRKAALTPDIDPAAVVRGWQRWVESEDGPPSQMPTVEALAIHGADHITRAVVTASRQVIRDMLQRKKECRAATRKGSSWGHS